MVNCNRWHRLGERCECGHITVPARFYWDGKEIGHDKAEAAYLDWLEAENPALWRKLAKPFKKPVTETRNVAKPVTVCLADVEPSHRCEECGRGIPKPARGPWPTHCSAKCRQAAYRGRHA